MIYIALAVLGSLAGFYIGKWKGFFDYVQQKKPNKS